MGHGNGVFETLLCWACWLFIFCFYQRQWNWIYKYSYAKML